MAPGGPDPDGPGKWQTTLMRPTKIADREKFVLVVNGFFLRRSGQRTPKEPTPLFTPRFGDRWTGPAVTDGKIWSTGTNDRPCLVLSEDRRAAIKSMTRPAPKDWEAISGNTMLVQDGVAVPHTNKKREPRTAVGLDAKENKLIIMVVDGASPDLHSV